MTRTILTAVGYNPYRRFRASTGDYVMVVGAVVVAVGLLVWALFA